MVETQLKSQSFSEISALPFLLRPLNGLFIPNQFGFFSPFGLVLCWRYIIVQRAQTRFLTGFYLRCCVAASFVLILWLH